VIGQPQAIMSAVRSDRVQVAQGLGPSDADLLLSSDSTIERLTAGGPECYVLGMNASPDIFSDLARRQAVAIAIDRDRINEQVFGGIGQVSNLWWFDTTPGWDEATANRWRYDPDRARSEVSRLGLEGVEIPITVQS